MAYKLVACRSSVMVRADFSANTYTNTCQQLQAGNKSSQQTTRHRVMSALTRYKEERILTWKGENCAWHATDGMALQHSFPTVYKQFTVLFNVASYAGPMAWYPLFIDDVMLWYNFLQNVCEALHVLRLLHGGTLKALHSLVHPGGVEGRPSWTP